MEEHDISIPKNQWNNEKRREFYREALSGERIDSGEERLYEPVRQSIWNLFSKLGKTHIEIPGRTKKFSPELMRKFENVSLNIIDREEFYPDLMGFVQTTGYPAYSLIVCEVKDEALKLRDIMQARNYGVIFGVQYDLLVSSEPLPEQIRRLYLDKRLFLGRFAEEWGKNVRIALFDESEKKTIGSSWVPSPPFNLSCATCESDRNSNWKVEEERFECGKCKNAYVMPSF